MQKFKWFLCIFCGKVIQWIKTKVFSCGIPSFNVLFIIFFNRKCRQINIFSPICWSSWKKVCVRWTLYVVNRSSEIINEDIFSWKKVFLTTWRSPNSFLWIFYKMEVFTKKRHFFDKKSNKLIIKLLSG